jgi:hypothetical protein
MRFFSPGRAYWNQRFVLAESRERILALSEAVGRPSDLSPFQFAQLMSTALEFSPEIILELGRGLGNSTCAFTEAANLLTPKKCHVISLCVTDAWDRETVPHLQRVVAESWFRPLVARQEDILSVDYPGTLGEAGRHFVGRLPRHFS